MVWRNCVTSVVLAQELNDVYDLRDKSSDGTIGDAAHASRKSDHNPWVKDGNGVGVVRARDIDEDLDGNTAPGTYDAKSLFDKLLALAKAGDPRLNGGGYLIYEGHIYSEKNNWAARPYTGANAHKQHVHVSFSLNAKGYDSNKSWGLRPSSAPKREGFGPGSKGEGVAFIGDLGNLMAKAGMALNKRGDRSRVQIPIPQSPARRKLCTYNGAIQERVRELQRYFVVMWKLGGKKGPEPKVTGIADESTLNHIAFWAPIAVQNLSR
jgi:hypothetical protein